MEFAEIIKKFSPSIKQLAQRIIITSPSLDKEDLYQEMLFHLWTRWKNGELNDKTDAYIVQSCYFYLKNYLRLHKEKAKLISLSEPIGEEQTYEDLIPSQTPFFDRKIDDAIFIQQMKENELTRREKEVASFLQEGYTLREIGKKLGISHVRVLKIKENIGKKFKKGGYQKG